MKRRHHNKAVATGKADRDRFDVDSLLHPAQAFAHPTDVLHDCDLTVSEKRAILASWAWDLCAMKAKLAPRRAPGSSRVCFDDIMDALRMLDRQAVDLRKPVPHYRRVLEARRPAGPGSHFGRSTPSDRPGPRLH